MGRPTLFHVELMRRGWDNWEEFCIHFHVAARVLADLTGRHDLAIVGVGRATLERWAKPTYRGRPRPEAAQILEHMFGYSVDELFSPAYTPAGPRQPAVEAAAVIDDEWSSTSRLIVPATGAVGMWELTGRDSLAGTAAAVLVRSAVNEEEGDELRLLVPGESLNWFLRSAASCGFLMGVVERAGDYGLCVLDVASARGAQSVASSRSDPIVIPKAYLLDDLTYGILWFLRQLDDGLLADDQDLEAKSQNLGTCLALPRSDPTHQLLELTSAVSSGREEGFRDHIERELQGAREVTAFWTRKQPDAGAAAWMVFSRKIDHLRCMGRFADCGHTASRVFSIPETAVTGTAPYERILPLLAIALMERYSIPVRLVTDAEHSTAGGAACAPGQGAGDANWVRTGEARWAGNSGDPRPVDVQVASERLQPSLRGRVDEEVVGMTEADAVRTEIPGAAGGRNAEKWPSTVSPTSYGYGAVYSPVTASTMLCRCLAASHREPETI